MKTNLSLLRKSLITLLLLLCAAVIAFAFAACKDGDSPEPNTPDNGEQEGGQEEGGENNGGQVEASAALASGSYWGTYSSVSQMGTTNYVIYFTLDADEETYYYECHYVSHHGTPATYYHTENGTYTDDGENLTLTPAGAESSLTATISEDGFTLSRALTQMSSKEYEVTYTKGNAPIYVTYKVDNTEFAKIGYKEATDEVVAVYEPDIYGCVFNEWANVPETAGEGATVQADYSDGILVFTVDNSWMPEMMQKMMAPVIVVNYDENDEEADIVFGIYNGSDRGVCKGWGTVEITNDGDEVIYTLVYKDTYATHKDQTTTCSFDNGTGTATVLSKIFYGAASINQTVSDTDDTFKPFTATVKYNGTVNDGEVNGGEVDGNEE